LYRDGRKDHQSGECRVIERISASIGLDAAQLAVEIPLAWLISPNRRRNRRVLVRPPGAGQQSDRPSVQPRVHPITVEFDSWSQSGPSGGSFSSLVELWFDPLRQRFVADVRCPRFRHVRLCAETVGDYIGAISAL
jgi:hypothetical protein